MGIADWFDVEALTLCHSQRTRPAMLPPSMVAYRSISASGIKPAST
jgi:hypothetical protein